MKTPIKFVSLLFYLAAFCTSPILGQPSSHSVLSSGKWYKIGINTTGVYKLTVSDLNSLNGVSISKIAIYGLRGGILDEVNYSTTPDNMIQYPIRIQDNNHNGIFDGNDYLLFFAEGASVWQYDATNNRFSYQHNPYCSTNYCYLTTTENSPTRIASATPCQPGLYPISRYTAVAVHDNDLTNAYGSGRIYVGEQFSAAVPNRSIALTIDPIPQGGIINCRFAFANMNAANSQVVLSLGSESCTTALPAEIGYNTNVHRFTSDGSTSLLFNIQYRPSEAQGDGYLDYIETNHLALLNCRAGQHIYHFSPEDSTTTYTISNCQSNTLLWDISSPYNVRQFPTTAGTTTFSFKGDADHRLVAFTEQDCFKPSGILPIENQDLHGLPDVDYVIVTHPKYLSQSQQLADLHQTQSMLDVAIVTDQQVFDEFSSGRQDPMAIRQLMRVLYLRSQRNPSLKAPKYLLLFGKGTYDNRNIEGNNETTVVTYESVSSFNESSSFGSDDFFGYLDNGESGQSTADKLDISIGRLPARNTEEANHLVEKIKKYMEREDLTDENIRGDWRNYVTLLADDADPSCLHDTTFTHSAEYLANTIKQKYPHINIDKIYADAYVEQSGAIGSFYPDANNAIKKRMDYGCLLFNYIGHGSLQYIGTERYVTETEVSNYTNHRQHTILVTSTCTYGKYDIPGETCGAEMWLHAKGGAIASISPARPISHNESFNTMLCSLLASGQYRIGDAMRNAKNTYNVSHSITLLGDPALMPSVPQYNAVVTAINNRTVTDSVADSVMVLSEVVVEGEIQQDSLCVSNFNGTLFASVYDRESKALTLGNDNENSEVQFSQQKSLLHKGSTTITNGKFQYRFIVPRDVAYNYERGKISHYARSTDGTDASGVYQNIYFGGFDTTLTISEFRPQIRLFMGDTLFRDGGLTDDSPTLIAFISDSVGINAVGSGIGHDITAVIDNKPNTLVVLNDFYEPDITNSHNGQLRYAFENLEEGYHSITLKVWNIYNYSNSATIHFVVTGKPASGDVTFFAYPNPASTNTQLRIELSDTKELSSAEISIYSYTGTLVTTLHPSINNDSYVIGPCAWNLTNAAGALLHSGIYIARMILTTTDGETISKQCKIVIQHQ